MLSGRNRALFLSLAGFALLLAVGLPLYRAPTLPPKEAPPTEFSARRAHAILLGLLGNAAPHPIGSAENARVRGAIVSTLWELGYVTELESGWVCSDFGVCGAPTNIVAYLKGGGDGDAVLLAAHYDSVPAGAGASDDGAGVAAVLEIARVLTLAPKLRHPVVLLITDGEEAGLLGAELFVRNHPLAGRIKAAVNLEARGTHGPSLMFETGSANRWSMQLYGASIARPMTNSLFYFAYQALPNNTDFSIFKRAGMQGFNFAYIGGEGNYHTPQDDAEHVALSSLQQQGSNALAMLTALGRRANLRAAGGEAVYFDLFTRGLVQWPASACVPAAVVALLFGVLLGAVLLARRQVGARQILWGTLFALVHLSGGAIAAGLLVGTLTWAGLLPALNGSPFIAHPLPMTIACVALALAVGSGCSMAAQRRAGFWGGWCGAALTMQSLALVLAVMAPGTCFIALIAAFALCAAAAPGIVHIWRRTLPAPASPWQTDLAVVVPALLTAGVLLPVLLMLYTALGSPAWPIDAFAASLATLLLLPALSAATRRARARLAGVSMAAAVIGVALTLLLPTYSAAWPMRLNFTYRVDVDRQRAEWLVVSSGRRLPHAVAAAARFEQSEHVWHATAPFHPELAAPLLTVKEHAQHHYVVHLESARHAPRAFIVFPPQAHVLRAVSLTTAGSQQFELRAGAQGATRLDFSNLPKGGVDVAFDIRDAAEVRLTGADVSYGLPADGEPLRQARPADATSSQDGDVTVVQLTVALAPASGRGNVNLNPP